MSERVWRVCRRCHRRLAVDLDETGRIVGGLLARDHGGKYVCVARSNCRYASQMAKRGVRVVPPLRVWSDGSTTLVRSSASPTPEGEK